MSEADALIAAIRQAPDDDAPRLIYADWLDEHGQPERAEFIRVQIGLSRKPSRKFRAREAALLKKHYTILVGEFALPGFRFGFNRGFIDRFGHSGVFRRVGGDNSRHGRGRPPNTDYLRFYPDGTVERASCPDGTRFAPAVVGYFGANGLSTRGQYSFDAISTPATIEIVIHQITYPKVSDTYRGTFASSTMDLNRSRTGRSDAIVEEFSYMPIPGFDSSKLP